MESQLPSTTSAPEPSKPPRLISFRSSMLRSLVSLILLLSIAILAVSIHASNRVVRTLCKDLVVRSLTRTEKELRRFFEPIPAQLAVADDWSEKGLFDHHDAERMNSLFAPIIDEYRQISGLSSGDADGVGFMLLRQADGWLNRQVDHRDGRQTMELGRWDKLGDPPERWEEELDYDPRIRPWYQIATEDLENEADDNRTFWTDPYIFFTTGELGITASRRIRDPDGKLTVLAFDVQLHDISELTAGLDTSPNGFALVTDMSGRLVGLPRDARLDEDDEQKAAYLKRPSEIDLPLFAAAAVSFRKHFRLKDGERFDLERGLSPENVPFRWRYGGEAWWTAIKPCQIARGPELWIAITVPEDDFLAELKAGRIYSMLLAVSALAIAALISMHLARRYSRPIQNLIEQSGRLTKLNTEKIDARRSEIREIAQLHDAQESMRLALDSFAKYVPSEVVRELLAKGEAAVIGGRSTPMSILFTDIAGFSSIAEAMEPAALTEHMATYFEAMIRIIESHGGTVDKLIGDAIVAFWGAPKFDESHAGNTVRATLDCLAQLDELNAGWEADGLPPLPTRFGISTGAVVVGNVGSPGRLSYTALGDSVNLASRLEGANSFYGTSALVSSSTQAEAGSGFCWRRVDLVAVKGRSKPELIFEPLGFEGELGKAELDWTRTYEEALDAYLDKRFGEAIRKLEALVERRPSDRSATRLLSRCQKWMDEPLPDDWD
ncbi:MAG: adenylate/guanylate cyclase domain-containing protein, partial [Verrucomicrobiales bacterium]